MSIEEVELGLNRQNRSEYRETGPVIEYMYTSVADAMQAAPGYIGEMLLNGATACVLYIEEVDQITQIAAFLTENETGEAFANLELMPGSADTIGAEGTVDSQNNLTQRTIEITGARNLYQLNAMASLVGGREQLKESARRGNPNLTIRENLIHGFKGLKTTAQITAGKDPKAENEIRVLTAKITFLESFGTRSKK